LSQKLIIETDYRPEHCDKNGCVMKEVFQYLPPYPKNFIEIWSMVYYGRLSYLENFSEEYPDEWYWKQPEFYADSFKRNMYYYTSLKPGYTASYLNIAGYGPYPSTVVIRDVKPGEEIDNVISFWHASWGVVKYQGIGIGVSFPEEDATELGRVSVKQDPEEARKCFDIDYNPKYILLEPTYPVFFYNWTYKIKARIKVNPDCKPGWYVINFNSVSPPKDVEEKWIKKYLTRYTEFSYAGVPWKVFIQVVQK